MSLNPMRILRLEAHCFVTRGWRFRRCVSPKCGKLYPMSEEKCDLGKLIIGNG